MELFSPKKLAKTPRHGSRDGSLGSSGDVEMVDLEPKKKRKMTRFKGIDPTVEYSFRVCTLINGKTISRKIWNLKPDETQAKDL